MIPDDIPADPCGFEKEPIEFGVSGDSLQQELMKQYAGLAMQALITSNQYQLDEAGMQAIAEKSHDLAVAMIVERRKRVTQEARAELARAAQKRQQLAAGKTRQP